MEGKEIKHFTYLFWRSESFYMSSFDEALFHISTKNYKSKFFMFYTLQELGYCWNHRDFKQRQKKVKNISFLFQINHKFYNVLKIVLIHIITVYIIKTDTYYLYNNHILLFFLRRKRKFVIFKYIDIKFIIFNN